MSDVVRIADVLAGRAAVGSQVTVQGWVRTRRDSKAGLSFVQVHDGSSFHPLQIVAKSDLPNYEDEIAHLTAGCAVECTGTVSESQGQGQSLEVQADSAPVLNYLGYMNADRNVRLEEALELTQRAVEQDPGSAAYLDSMGWALFRLNRLEAAEEAVRKALDKDTENAVILDHLGDILHKRGRVAEALVYWQKALKGEDEEGELNRPRVETKVRDAQGVLRAQQNEPRPPSP